MGLSVALIEPEIAPNTGNIARLCAAADTSLHLIGPLGFRLDDARMKRAGLDYWEHVDLWVHPHWRVFRDALARDRCLYFSSYGTRSYLDAPYAPNSVLVFGNETQGMPRRILEKYPDRIFRVPMRHTVRSLNLATAAGVVLYEAVRQLGIVLEDQAAARPPEERPSAQTPV